MFKKNYIYYLMDNDAFNFFTLNSNKPKIDKVSPPIIF